MARAFTSTSEVGRGAAVQKRRSISRPSGAFRIVAACCERGTRDAKEYSAKGQEPSANGPSGGAARGILSKDEESARHRRRVGAVRARLADLRDADGLLVPRRAHAFALCDRQRGGARPGGVEA